MRVPVDQLPRWLQTRDDWRPLGRDEYRRLLEAARPTRPAPPAAWIEQAEYMATFVDGTLRSGTLTAQVRRTDDRPELLSLEPLNLALTELAWPDGTTVWGATPEGRTALWVDRPAERLTGRWSLKGRRLARTVEFDVQLAPATVSRLVLRVPEGHVPVASAGHLTGPHPAGEAGWKLWRLELGSQTRCRLTIGRSADPVRAAPLLLAESDVFCAVQQDGVRLQAEFKLEVLESPVERLTFLLPADVEVYSLTYGGDATLAWRSSPRGEQQQIVAELPDPLLGRSRPIRLQGLAPVVTDQQWTTPHAVLKDAVLLTGQLHVKVVPPLEVRTFRGTGVRQTATVSDAAEGETLTFHQYAAEARLHLEVGHPRLDISARTVMWLNLNSDPWSVISEVEWQARSGSTFVVQCELPAEWEITEVVGPSGSPGSRVTNWEVDSAADGGRRLSIEFLNSLAPDIRRTVRIRARRLPDPAGASIGLPVLQPLGCGSVEMLLAVAHPPTGLAALRPSSQFEVVKFSDLPRFAEGFALWEEFQTERPERSLILSANVPLPTGELSLENIEPPVDARVWMTLDLGAERLTETLTAVFHPQEPVDRVFVYLNGETDIAPLTWNLAADGAPRVGPRRTPAAQHAEWNLPPEGELWEIRLPVPQAEPFHLIARRNRTPASSESPLLAFIPGMRDFRGIVELRAVEELNIDIHAAGLRALDSEAGEAERPELMPRPGQAGRLWRYRTVADRLSLRIREEAATPDVPLLTSLELQSLVSPGGSGDDLHWARFHVAADSGTGEFRFRLPRPAVLLAVRLNDEAVPLVQHENDYLLSALPTSRSHLVEIQYRIPTASGLLRDAREIVVPVLATDHTILHFDWNFGLSPEVLLSHEPEQFLLYARPADLPWTRRLFGVLGRPAGTEPFNPFRRDSWRSRSAGTQSYATSESSVGDFVPPDGWTIIQASAPRLPERLTLVTWRRSCIYLLAWTGLLGCLLLGCLLKTLGRSLPASIGGVWVSVCLTVALLAPPVFAEIAGSCLIGTVLAFLFPRHLIGRPSASGTAQRIPLGSTASFRHGSVSAAVLVGLGGLFLLGQTLAQDVPREAALPGEFAVLVPVGPDLKPAETVPVVYVTQGLLSQWEQAASGRTPAVEYLITSAEYHGRLDAQKTATVEARYRIALLAPAATAQVRLPVANAALGGPHACRVNGAPHPVVRDPDGDLKIELTRPNLSPPLQGGAGGGEAERQEAEGSNQEPLLFEVVLQLHPRTVSTPAGGEFEMHIPSVAASRLTMALSEDFSAVTVPAGRGELTAATLRNLTAELGRTDRLHVVWSAETERLQQAASLDAKVFCLAEVSATWLQLRCRVQYQVQRGSVDYVEWQLPPRAIVRQVTSEQMLDFQKLPAQGDDGSRLLVEFSAPQTDEFAVEAVLTLPLASAGALRVPAIDLFGGTSPNEAVRPTVMQVGLARPSDFRLITPALAENDRIRSISPESFLENVGSAAGMRRPEAAWQLQEPVELPFSLAPSSPRRTVWQTQEGRIGKTRLDWTLSAEIRTSAAAAFRHVMTVDPRLNIESISVREDQAERLVRWWRNGERLELVLRDKTSGTQELVLKGSLPLRGAEDTPLPVIDFVDAEIAESNLLLYRGPDVGVELAGDDPLATLDMGAARPENGTGVLLGQFRLSPGAALPRIRIVRQGQPLRVDSVTLVEQQAGGLWGLSTLLRFSESTEPLRPLRIRIPAELADDYELHLPDEVERRMESRPDGSLEVTLEPMESVADSLTLTVSATLPALANDGLLLPAVTVPETVPEESFLLLSPAGALRPAGSAVSRVTPGALPEWIADALPRQSDSTLSDAWLVRSPWEQPVRLRGVESAQEVRVPLVRTQTWLERDGTEFGWTEILLVSTGAYRLDVDWPADVRLRALFVDGRAAVPQRDGPGELSAFVDSASAPHVVTFCWTRRPDRAASMLRSVAREFPSPKSVTAEQSIVIFVPADGSRLVPRRGLQPNDAREHALDRLEGLLETVRAASEPETGPTLTWQTLLYLHDGFQRRFAPEMPQTEGDQAPANRFARIDAEIERLRPPHEPAWAAEIVPAPRQAFVDQPGAQDSAGRLNRRLIHGRLSSDEARPAVSFRLLDERPIIVALAVVCLLVFIPVLIRLVRLDAGGWLNAHDPACWALLGLIWWAGLAPSLLGLILLVIAAVAGLLERRRTTRRREVYL